MSHDVEIPPADQFPQGFVVDFEHRLRMRWTGTADSLTHKLIAGCAVATSLVGVLKLVYELAAGGS